MNGNSAGAVLVTSLKLTDHTAKPSVNKPAVKNGGQNQQIFTQLDFY